MKLKNVYKTNKVISHNIKYFVNKKSAVVEMMVYQNVTEKLMN